VTAAVSLAPEGRYEPAPPALADYGRMDATAPLALERPTTIDELAAIVARATRAGVPVVPRGAGHSQGGTARYAGAVVVDMRGLARVEVDAARSTFVADGGATWGSVLEAAAPHGLEPPVITGAFDVTVGGTLSVGGWGRGSWAGGIQADHCTELEVVLPDGARVTCGPGDPRFAASLCTRGAGPIIARVRHRLVPTTRDVRVVQVVYQDLDACVRDLRGLVDDPRIVYASCVDVRPFRTSWLYRTVLASVGGPAEPNAWRARLPNAYVTGVAVLGNRWAVPRHDDDRAPGTACPWFDAVTDWASAAALIPRVLGLVPRALVEHCTAYVLFSRVHAFATPSFPAPAAGPYALFGVHPTVPAAGPELAMALDFVAGANRLCAEHGARRYGSGWGA
jgi:hypothetical protein